MIRAYGLTPRLEELLGLGIGDKTLAEQIPDEAWAELPDRCQGLLLAFTSDLVRQAVAGQSPLLFVPRPNRPVDEALWNYLRRINALTNAMLAKGRHT